jgi:hypothetical protein
MLNLRVSQRGSLWFIVLLTVLLLPAHAAGPEGSKLGVKPQTCVSLHQGQLCYVHLQLSWRVAAAGDYCLYQSAQSEPLQCWAHASQGSLSLKLATVDTVQFYLKPKEQGQVLATSELSVSWVYEKKQKSRLTWRLF